MTYKIRINPLDPKSMSKALDDIQHYQDWLEECSKQLIATVAEYGVNIARLKFSDAMYAGFNDVTVEPLSKDDNTIVVRASGAAVMFIEYGTGLGMGDHPERPAGFTPGSYGKGRGKNPKGWFYVGTEGTNPPPGTAQSYLKKGRIHTYGNPANKCMYLTVQDLLSILPKVISETFVWKG